MRRPNIFSTVAYTRSLLLRPAATVDVARYPQGYVPLEGTEPIESVYALLKAGHFVAPLKTIETIHNVHIGVRQLCKAEHPVVSAQGIVSSHLAEKEILSKILIPRDFWNLSDFNDPELNQSFGVQNLYFDNYKWSQVLWKRFQLYVEEYFPLSEHSHLLYREYMQLIRSFSVFEQGARATPVLPKGVRLHPPYGVSIPTKSSLEPLLLLKQWLSNFRTPLSLNKVLVVNAGSGVAAFSAKTCNIPMVRGLDPRPRAVEACRKDASRHWKMTNVSFQVAELFPQSDEKVKYDAIIFYPDEDLVAAIDQEDNYAPGKSGVAGKVEEFFENAEEYLSDQGVLAVCCTNVNSLLRPNEAHPIEYEVKANRRYVILDYYDAPMKSSSPISTKTLDPAIATFSTLKKKLRSELWVLHKIRSINHFGFIHGLPGAKPPAHARNWGKSKALHQRRKVLREHVELMGGDWGDYKSRLMKMLQEQSDEPEDDVAESIRMSLDPSYPAELAEKAKKTIESNMKAEKEFHHRVVTHYGDKSPREIFDITNF